MYSINMNQEQYIKLSKYAKQQGVCYLTAFRWYQAGKIPGAFKRESGSVYVKTTPEKPTQQKVVIYSRVSNQSRCQELKYQTQRCLDFCSSKRLVVFETYSEIASGMNDNRRKFWEMLNENPTTIVIENKDRLTRFGFTYLERLLKDKGCEILVMNPNVNDEQDLIKDMVSVITSFCCRLYGLRRTKNKLAKIKAVISEVASQ